MKCSELTCRSQQVLQRRKENAFTSAANSKCALFVIQIKETFGDVIVYDEHLRCLEIEPNGELPSSENS